MEMNRRDFMILLGAFRLPLPFFSVAKKLGIGDLQWSADFPPAYRRAISSATA